MSRRGMIVLILAGLLLCAGLSRVFSKAFTASVNPTKPGVTAAVNNSDGVSKATTATPSFDRDQFSRDSAGSLWVIVNKRRALHPQDYAPQLTVPDVPLRLPASDPEMRVSVQAAPALKQLFDAAAKNGLQLKIASAYRSYQTQVSVYNAEVSRYGQQTADRESARPGHSEHQTGLAIDVEPASRQCEVETCFADTPEGKWLAANAYAYGFVIRYGKADEPVTGYTYEPWHLRYVGTALAGEVHDQGDPPLETFFNLGAAPDYR